MVAEVSELRINGLQSRNVGHFGAITGLLEQRFARGTDLSVTTVHPMFSYVLFPVVFYFHATLNSESFISTLNLTLAFNARKTFKIVSIVTFFVLLSNFEI